MGRQYKHFKNLLETYQSIQVNTVQSLSVGNAPALVIAEHFPAEFVQVVPRAPTSDESVGFYAPTIQTEVLPISNFRMFNYLGKTQNSSILIETDTALPLSGYQYENWWEYEEFARFPQDQTYFKEQMEKWYVSEVLPKGQFVGYSSLWCANPTDPNIDWYMYYYAITPRHAPPWRLPVPIQVLYEANRRPIYLLLAMAILCLYLGGMTRRQRREALVYLNEDYWIRDIQKFIKTASGNSGTGLLSPEGLTWLNPLGNVLFAFWYGPATLQQSKSLIEKINSLPREELEQFLKKELGV